MPLHVSSTRAHRQEAKILLYSLWYHYTYRWPSRAQVCATYRCDDTRGCIVQFWPPDDEHMCPKHVQAWNKLIIKFSASSWLILINKYIEMHGQQNIKIYIKLFLLHKIWSPIFTQSCKTDLSRSSSVVALLYNSEPDYYYTTKLAANTCCSGS